MLTKLNIPKKINVGFQNRQDTYTGKLAYIIYTDAKGVLRKEKSWQSWRDQKIDAKEFDNVPTSGFVLNKKVGGYGGWNPRQTYVRIYDPRDFEFEITVPNLLFILEECSAIKGKGLEGEFVYSWDGTELVLLPATSKEYKASAEFTELQTKKITKADIKEGCVYTNKDNEQVMYLGRHPWYELVGYGSSRRFVNAKQHIFVSVDGKSKYWPQAGFTKLAARIGDDPSPLYADEFEKFTKSVHGTPPNKIVGVPNPAKINANNHYVSHYGYLKEGGNFYGAYINYTYDYGPQGGVGGYSHYSPWSAGRTYQQPKLVYRLHRSHNAIVLKDAQISLPDQYYGHGGIITTMSADEIEKLDIQSVFLENEHGAQIAL